MRYVTTALVVAVLILSVQLHSAKERIAVLEDPVGLGPLHAPDKIDVRRWAQLGFHTRQSHGQGVHPHFPLKGHFALSPWHKSHVKSAAPVVVEGVEDVESIMRIGPVVQW